MCGIAGAFSYKRNTPISLELLKAMTGAIAHRGPDDEGYYVKDNIGLGFRRLSIIDLYTGNQPIHNEDQTIWVVFNGEIYNYLELREDLLKKGHTFYTKSDTEVIVHLYEEYGERFTLQLNGMFGIALWDERQRTLLLARDRPGIKPLYYAETSDGLIFASEIKALLKSGISRDMDYEALNQYLAYGFVPSPLTGFKAVRKLSAGHMIICTSESSLEKEYWDLSGVDTTADHIDQEETVDRFVDALTQVLHRQMRSDVPVGIFLSGGIDSALIASVAAEQCNAKLNAFTVGFTEESYNELASTRSVAERLGLPLSEIILSEADIFREIDQIMSYLDEPFFDYSTIPVYFVSKLARESVKTVLSGDGGDELFGGYPTHYLHRITEMYRKLPVTLRKGIRSLSNILPVSHNYLSLSYKIRRFAYGSEFPFDQAHYRWKLIFDAEEKKRLLREDFIQAISDLEPFYLMGGYFLKAKDINSRIEDMLMYVDFKTHLQDDFLQKTDRMSMSHSLEVRVPLLDNAIIDFSRGVALDMKIHGFQTKYLMRKALSRFQPRSIAFAKKRGFTPPLAFWIKKGLKDYVFSILSPAAISELGFLNHRYVMSIINAHVNGQAENSRAIWALVSLVNWHRKYVSG